LIRNFNNKEDGKMKGLTAGDVIRYRNEKGIGLMEAKRELEKLRETQKAPVAHVPCNVGLDGQIVNMKDIIKRILEMPEMKAKLKYLDKGIGTKTQNVVLLEARKIITEKAD